MGKQEIKVLAKKEVEQLPKPVGQWIIRSKHQRGIHVRRNENRIWMVIAAGPKPNPGYQLEYVGQDRGEDPFRVKVKELPPPRGMMFPQVISYPYLVLELPEGVKPTVINEETGKPWD